MSYHNREFPRQAELNKALKDHGLEVKKPSQLSDAFRLGWRAMSDLADAAPVASQEGEAIQALREMHRFFQKWPSFVPAPEFMQEAIKAVEQMNAALAVPSQPKPATGEQA
jgi:hypothetical protein